jgi:uncharacterized protein (DUF2236 family)
MLLTEVIRRQIGAAILERVFTEPGSVMGKGSHSRSPEAERWFSADRPIRQVHRDYAMFVGGMTAILLQSLHPLTMAAIADHSAYQTDPWGRMRRPGSCGGLPASPVGQARAVPSVAAAHRGRPRPSCWAARGERDPVGPVGTRARRRLRLY